MEDKVKNLLDAATTIPVIEDGIPGVFPCITFHFYNESGALYGAGIATEEGASCQVDIWYKSKTEAVKTAIETVRQAIINEKHFAYPTKETTFEKDTKIWHTNINFDLIKESEV